MLRLTIPTASTHASGAAAIPVRDRRSLRSHLISQELFRDALVRERKLADRFEGAFAVLLITLDRRRLDKTTVQQLAEAMLQASTGADVIGWFEQDVVLGLIRSVAPVDLEDAATALTAAVRRDVDRIVTPFLAPACTFRCETYSSQSDTVAPSSLAPGSLWQHPRYLARMAAKRALDLFGSLACLIAFAPIFLVVAAVVKLTSKGTVLFRQQRVGRAGRPFMMLKFRTMHVGTDERIHKDYVESLIQQGPAATSGTDPVFKLVNDPRITSVGAFLRRSSLDELPQLLNVLRGEMSLVGPRPPIPYEVACYKSWHRRRVLEAKPGMTGLWQVTGRSRTTFDDMVRLDLRYVATCSFWTDVKILLATPRAVLSGSGAR
jgi:lipopolysaccharide/colanic/teichoic acid biosynthesis glycosyltransferase